MKSLQLGEHTSPDLETLLSDLQRVVAVKGGLRLIGGDQGAVKQQVDTAQELRGYLDAFVVDRCERFDRDRSARELQGILALHSVGPLWVFSTNYDRVVELACEATPIRWSDGFEVNSPNAVANWMKQFDTPVRVVKLHGSVNWFEDDPAGVLYRLDRGYSLPAYDFRLMRGDQRLKPLMVIPTLEKEALSDPYIGLAMKFTDVLRETKLLIVVGNSQRDKHIKGYIRERLDELHVLLVSPNAARSREIFGDSGRTHALNAGCSEFLTLGASRLLDLAQALAPPDVGPAEVHNLVEKFVAEVSHLAEEDTSLQANADLYRAWKLLDEDVLISMAANGANDTFLGQALGRSDLKPVVRCVIDHALASGKAVAQ